jgi:hypothetical protein
MFEEQNQEVPDTKDTTSATVPVQETVKQGGTVILSPESKDLSLDQKLKEPQLEPSNCNLG